MMAALSQLRLGHRERFTQSSMHELGAPNPVVESSLVADIPPEPLVGNLQHGDGFVETPGLRKPLF